MAIKERVSLFKRYSDERIHQVEPFRTYYLIMEGTNTEPQYFWHLDRYLAKHRVRNNVKLVFLTGRTDRGGTRRASCSPSCANGGKQGRKRHLLHGVRPRRLWAYENPAEAYLAFVRRVKATAVDDRPPARVLKSGCFCTGKGPSPSISGPIPEYFEPALNSRYTYLSKLVQDVFGFNRRPAFPPRSWKDGCGACPGGLSYIRCGKWPTKSNVSAFIKDCALTQDLRWVCLELQIMV